MATDKLVDFDHVTDYISREAALACFHDWIDRYGHEHTADEMVEYQRIEELPVADAVEVVRCKDCKLMRHDEHGYWCINDYQACLDPEKDYCSRAVRKADNGSEQDEAQSKEGG